MKFYFLLNIIIYRIWERSIINNRINPLMKNLHVRELSVWFSLEVVFLDFNNTLIKSLKCLKRHIIPIIPVIKILLWK